MSRARERPFPALSDGARVAVVAPSGPFSREHFEAGLAVLTKHFEVSVAADILERQGYLAGSDGRRAAELQRAITDPRIDGIIAARGGYGAMRLLHTLTFAALQRRPKLLVGFSDVTALHAQWQRQGVGSLHGTMAAALAHAGPDRQTRFLDAVAGRFSSEVAGLTPLAGGRAEGPLFGGNLAVLCALLGTPYAPPFDGGVLFLEDVGERPFRVDRMLTTLRLGQYLQRVAAVVLGAFTHGPPGPDGITLADVLYERLSDLPCPVLTGLRAGHLEDNLELPFGRRVFVDGDQGLLAICD